MAKRGRKPLPANVHMLHGNPSKLAESELTDAIDPPVEIPGCPPHLLAGAKREWKRITPLLEELGLISHLDRTVLAVYCQAYARWEDVEREIKAQGDKGLQDMTPSGYRQMSVLLQISNRMSEQLFRCMRELGLSPSARAGLRANKPQGELFADPMEAFLQASAPGAAAVNGRD